MAEKLGYVDLSEDAEGENFEVEERYHAIVRSKKADFGPTCFYDDGTKEYLVTDGIAKGVFTRGEYLVYELDLRGIGLTSAKLSDIKTMEEVLTTERSQVKLVHLVPGQKYSIPPGVLHQPYGKGILEIWVTEGYPEKAIETFDVNLRPG